MWSRTALLLFSQVHASELISIGSISFARLPTMTTISRSIYSNSEGESSLPLITSRREPARESERERNDKSVQSSFVSMGLRRTTSSTLRKRNNEVGHLKSLLRQLLNWCQSEWYSPGREQKRYIYTSIASACHFYFDHRRAGCLRVCRSR